MSTNILSCRIKKKTTKKKKQTKKQKKKDEINISAMKTNQMPNMW